MGDSQINEGGGGWAEFYHSSYQQSSAALIKFGEGKLISLLY
jgi:hypothetical protein